MAFLAWPAIEASPALRDVSLVAVRSTLLAASAGISLLLLRGARSRV
jgi:hypothetical protein